MTPPSSTISRPLLGLVLAVLLLQAGIVFVRSFPGPSHPVPPDFGQFYSAALALRAGEPEALYFTDLIEGLTVPRFPESRLGELAAERGLTRYSYYVYPPWVAGLFVPFTALSPYRAHAAFYVVNWVLAGLALLVLARAVPRGGAGAALAVGFVLVSSFFLVQSLESGQTSILVLLLLVLFARAAGRGRDAEAGLWWALMAGIKLFPVLFVPFLVFRRKWRLLLACGVWGAALLAASIAVAGLDTHLRYLELLRDYGGYTTGRATNFSIQAVLMRWLEGANPAEVDILFMPPAIVWASRAFAVATFAATAWVIHRGRGWTGPLAEVSAIALMVPFVFSTSPFAWSHHMLALALPLAVVAGWVIEERPPRWLPTVAAWTAAWGGLLVLHLVNRAPTGSGDSPVLLALLTLPLLAIWLVFGLAARHHFRGAATP